MSATTAIPPAAPPAGDELDDLFDYNVNLDDVFRDVDTNMNVPKETSYFSRAKDTVNVDSLGIDEAVKIERKRAPVAKLDEARYTTHPLQCTWIGKLRFWQTSFSGRNPEA